MNFNLLHPRKIVAGISFLLICSFTVNAQDTQGTTYNPPNILPTAAPVETVFVGGAYPQFGSFSIYGNCPPGTTVPYYLDANAVQLCSDLKIRLYIYTDCPDVGDQLAALGFNYIPGSSTQQPLIWIDLFTGDIESWRIDIPCNCYFSVSLSLEPLYPNLPSNCYFSETQGYTQLIPR